MRTFDIFFEDGKKFEVVASKAPEPSDVIWENQGYSNRERHVRSILVTLVCIILIFSGFFGLAYLNLALVPPPYYHSNNYRLSTERLTLPLLKFWIKLSTIFGVLF